MAGERRKLAIAANPNLLHAAGSVASILHNARVFNFRNRDTRMEQLDFDQLVSRVSALFEALNERQIPYLLVGGIAMLVHIEGRNTQDIDLIMARSDLTGLGQMDIAEENRNFIRADYQGLQVDLLLSQNPLFKLVEKQYKSEISWGERRIPCATPQGLVILKLYALPSLYRQGQFDRAALYETDILQLSYKYNLDLDAAIQVVDPFLIESDRTEIRSVASDIERRIQRIARAAQKPDLEPG